jgi:hypothetical protein
MSRATVELDGIECASCGMLFGITQTYLRKRLEDHKGFYCPNGHANYFPQETEAERLRGQLEFARNRARGEERRREVAERSLAATKGVVTKLKKRVANGVCPCCNRHFADLQRHMDGQHPDFTGGQ